LTKRECEILLLVAEGLRNRAIANKLCITPKTVAFHISTILDKLGVESRHEATTWLRKYFPNDPEELQG
jgi:DNA-binding NarL/FixJ family response regulator